MDAGANKRPAGLPCLRESPADAGAAQVTQGVPSAAVKDTSGGPTPVLVTNTVVASARTLRERGEGEREAQGSRPGLVSWACAVSGTSASKHRGRGRGHCLPLAAWKHAPALRGLLLSAAPVVWLLMWLLIFRPRESVGVLR